METNKIEELMNDIKTLDELKKIIINYLETPQDKPLKTYHESQKKAIKKYIVNHREKYNEYHRKRHHEKMATDEDYRKKYNERMRRNYLKKKEQKLKVKEETKKPEN